MGEEKNKPLEEQLVWTLCLALKKGKQFLFQQLEQAFHDITAMVCPLTQCRELEKGSKRMEKFTTILAPFLCAHCVLIGLGIASLSGYI